MQHDGRPHSRVSHAFKKHKDSPPLYGSRAPQRHQLLHVLRQDVALQVHASPGPVSRRACISYVCGMIVSRARRLERRDRQADAVDRDRAFVHQVPVEFLRAREFAATSCRRPADPARGTRRCRPRGPARCGRSAGRSGDSGRSRFTREPARRSPRLVRRSVSGARSARERRRDADPTAVRHTPFTAMLAPSRDIAASPLHAPSGAHPRARLDRFDRAQLFNDPGEHPVSFHGEFVRRNRMERDARARGWRPTRRRRPMPPASGSACRPPRIFGP